MTYMTSRESVPRSRDSNANEENSRERRASPAGQSRSDSPIQYHHPRPDMVLASLADSDCQTILAACAGESQTVSDIVDGHEIPTATAYRKVDKLVEAGLLTEHVEIRLSGRNEHRYTLSIQTVHLNLTESGPPEAIISLPGTNPPSVAGFPMTDGGQHRYR